MNISIKNWTPEQIDKFLQSLELMLKSGVIIQISVTFK